MQKFTFNREKTRAFTDQQNQLVYHQNYLLSFINRPFSIEGFRAQMEEKKHAFSLAQRGVLHTVLVDNYKNKNTSELTKKHIDDLLKEETFTITTGHQLSLFTGPVYFVYKILHVIKICDLLKKEYPANNFVPVFWMASEDHDFEEIQSVELFNHTMTWETEQKGPVGRFDLEGFTEIKQEFSSYFSGEAFDEINEILANYTGKNLAEATFNLVNRLFSKYGLVIVDGDQEMLKRTFLPVINKELETSFSFKQVSLANELLIKEGLKVQVNPREINLFYIEDGVRERILHLDEGFFIEGKGKYTLEALKELAESNPSCISPNVVMRPVYQETVLPNLCYVGGAGEISYWLQLKGVFNELGLPYPMIQVRNSLIWIDGVNAKKIAKIDLKLEELFEASVHLKKKFLEDNAEEDVDFSIIEEHFDSLRTELLDKISKVDSNLDKYAQAELVRMEKQLISIREKLLKSVKSKHENALITIDQIKNKLFPNGGLQERSMNFFNLCASGDVEGRLDYLYSVLDPFEQDLIVIRE